MSTTIRLTSQSERLLKQQLAASPHSSPEEIIERALENLARQNGDVNSSEPEARMTPAEAYADMMELRNCLTLGGIKIKDLINEGRKY